MASTRLSLAHTAFAIGVLLVIADGVQSSQTYEYTKRWHADVQVAAGIPARAGEFPASVSIHSAHTKQHVCAGTLLDASHVLTAAHCLANGGEPDFYIVADDLYNMRRASDARRQTRAVRTIHVHPAFAVKIVPRSDVAVMRLQQPFEVTRTLVPMLRGKLRSDDGGEMCAVGGWSSGQNGICMVRLQKQIVRVLSREECEAEFDEYGVRLDETFCGVPVPVAGAAHGDIGAGMVCAGQLVGFLSFGLHIPGHPSVYVTVDAFKGFIDSVVNNIDGDVQPS